MTTLLQVANRLITSLHLDRFDIEDWPDDSREAYLELKQVIEDEKVRAEQHITKNTCSNCKHTSVNPFIAPCNNCVTNELFIGNWEPKP